MLIAVNNDNKFAYNVIIEEDFSALAIHIGEANILKRRFCIITDSNVSKVYLDEVSSILKSIASELYVYEFKAGEESKSLDNASNLYRLLIEYKFDRNDVLIALGGGVTGDLCGYVAATYLRGIRYIQIPTSLLAQVDSAIGAKTALNFLSYKNVIGAFYLPALVYINVTSLKSLDDRQLASGMAEVIKAAMIKDYDFFKHLETMPFNLRVWDTCSLVDMIYKSILIKKDIVESDLKERGQRALLNFGHTIGHALESYFNFAKSHGECVALGCVAASFISHKYLLISEEDKKRIESLFFSYRLPVRLSEEVDIEEVLNNILNDKKMNSGQIAFILIKSIGDAFIDNRISKDDMREALRSIIDEE